MLVREATQEDWPQIWPFLRKIVRAGDTYAYEPDMDEGTARGVWCGGPATRTTVAVFDNAVLDTASMYPNRPGPGSHVASASVMVDPATPGRESGEPWQKRRSRGQRTTAIATSD